MSDVEVTDTKASNDGRGGEGEKGLFCFSNPKHGCHEVVVAATHDNAPLRASPTFHAAGCAAPHSVSQQTPVGKRQREPKQMVVKVMRACVRACNSCKGAAIQSPTQVQAQAQAHKHKYTNTSTNTNQVCFKLLDSRNGRCCLRVAVLPTPTAASGRIRRCTARPRWL